MHEKKSTAITAIHKAEFESFAASTLFSQGWNVLHRALDWQSVIDFLEKSTELPDVLLCSTDLIGIERESVEALKSRGVRIFLFTHQKGAITSFPEALPIPESTLELIGLVRGSIRSPLLRSTAPSNKSPRAKVLGVSSAHGATGCTTLAINLASELKIAGHRTLLVDADSVAPSVAVLLGEQGLHSARGFQQVSAGFWVMEINQSNSVNSIELLENARHEFDFIIIDLGIAHEVGQILSGRRWTGEAFVWTTSQADQLLILSKHDFLSLHRLRTLAQDLLRNSVRPEITFIQCAVKSGRRASSSDELFSKAVRALGNRQILRIPLDSRSITAAEIAHETLYQSDQKSLLRKSIQGLAGQITR